MPASLLCSPEKITWPTRWRKEGEKKRWEMKVSKEAARALGVKSQQKTHTWATRLFFFWSFQCNNKRFFLHTVENMSSSSSTSLHSWCRTEHSGGESSLQPSACRQDFKKKSVQKDFYFVSPLFFFLFINLISIFFTPNDFLLKPKLTSLLKKQVMVKNRIVVSWLATMLVIIISNLC